MADMSYGSPSLLRKFLPLTLLICSVAGGAYALYEVGRNDGYAPDQPIPFSHLRHAGELQIACQYCHANTEQGRVATVPSVNICMNCHNEKAGVGSGRPGVEYLKERYARGEEIPWVRVHDLADFVYFSHRPHMAKGIKCEECHGKVETMAQVEQVAPLTMGWCVDCHRKPDKEHPEKQQALTECTTCHQ